MEAARKLFTIKGFHNTTLEEIARHAEFGKGTIYNYFSSKEELFYGIVDRLTQDVLSVAQASLRANAGNARGQLVAYARGMISHARDNADLFSLVMREITHLDSDTYATKLFEIHQRARKLWEILAIPIKREIGPGAVRPFEPVRLAAIFDGMIRTYCMIHYGNDRMPGNNDIDDPGTFLVAVFCDGVAQRKRKG